MSKTMETNNWFSSFEKLIKINVLGGMQRLISSCQHVSANDTDSVTRLIMESGAYAYNQVMEDPAIKIIRGKLEKEPDKQLWLKLNIITSYFAFTWNSQLNEFYLKELEVHDK